MGTEGSASGRWASTAFLGLLAVVAAVAAACSSSTPSGGSGAAAGPGSAPASTNTAPPVELNFVFGSEKKDWLTDEIQRFNTAVHVTPSGHPIVVKGFARGSGEAVSDIVSQRVQADVFAPASSMYIDVVNRAWTEKSGALGGGSTGGIGGIAKDGKSLAVTPVVIGMWKPMAQALGWPAKPIGWSDLLTLAQDPKGWATLGHAEWGHLKFGHTHPELSNSGHLGILAEAYATTGMTRGLTVGHVDAPPVLEALRKIEGAVVHYGKSTGFFADKMLTRGPRYLSAAVLYENLVVQSYLKPDYQNREMDLVAIYPKEGTFWIDNPFLVLDTPWMTDDKRAAAKSLLETLLARDAQERAMTLYGFRPAEPSVAVGAPIDAAHGVDPKQPQTLLDLPPREVLDEVLKIWRQAKKGVDVYFVFDKSGSMAGEPLVQARQGAEAFVDMLDPRDRLSLVLFDHRVPEKIDAPVAMEQGRADIKQRLDATFADGGTAMYDSVLAAFRAASAAAEKEPGRNHAIVVLTDGKDENSSGTLDALIAALGTSGEVETTVRLFTIAYGNAADPAILAKIAEAGRGGAFTGDPKNIQQVYQDLAAFF